MAQELTINIVAHDRASQIMKSVGQSAKGMGASISAVSKPVTDVMGSLLSGVGMAAGAGIFNAIGNAVAGAGSAIVGFNGRLEQAQIAFTTMLGSGEKAEAFLSDLQGFAAKTPFEFPELLGASQKLLAMGFASNEVLPVMTAVGDAVAGLGGGSQEVDRVTTALGQMRAKGKVSQEEMMQLTEAGIPAWEMLAQKIGVDIPTAQEMATKGQIKASTAITALTEGMNERFGGMMEKQSQTFQGAMSTIKDVLTQTTATAFKPFFDLISAGALNLSQMLQSEAFTAFAQNVAAAIQGAIDAITPFANLVKEVMVRIFNPEGSDPMLFIGTIGAVFGLDSPAAAMIGEFVAFASETLQVMGQTISDVVGTVTQVLQGDWLPSDQIAPFTLAVGTIALVFKDVIMPAISTAVSWIMDRFGELVSWTQEKWPLISEIVGGVVDNIMVRVEGFVATVGRFWNEHGETIITVTTAAWEIVKTVVDTALTVVLNGIALGLNILKGDWAAAWENIKAQLGAIWDGIAHIVTTVMGAVAEVIGIKTAGIRTAWDLAWSGVQTALSTAWQNIQTTASNAMAALGTSMETLKTSIGNAARGMGESLVTGIRNGLSGLWQAIQSAVADALQRINVNVGPFGVSAGGITINGVRARAMGGPVLAGSPYLVGERGPELFIPSSIGQIVPNDRLGGSGGAPVGAGGTVINVNVNGPIYDLTDFEDKVIATLSNATMRGRFNRSALRP